MDLSNENIIHVKKGDVEYLQFKELLKYSDRVQHAYSLKPLQFSDENDQAPANYEKICEALNIDCLLYTSPSPRDRQKSRMPSSA